MVSSSSSRTKVFISYSHRDVRYLDQLVEHLSYYERNNLIEFWSDKKITDGAQWREEIKQAIETTKVAVLLISPSFSASKFIAENELPPLLHAAKEEGAVILPVIVRPSNFEDTELVNFQAVNNPTIPVAKMKGYQRDELWAKVVKDIKKAIIPLQSQNTTISSTPTAIPAITAMQLYGIFRHHGLAKNDGVENDSEYQSEGINPEGGAVDFIDYSSGQPYTISVFATSAEASQAATILYNGGNNAYIPNGYCMLHVSFASHASDFAIKEYTSIMDTMCKPSTA